MNSLSFILILLPEQFSNCILSFNYNLFRLLLIKLINMHSSKRSGQSKIQQWYTKNNRQWYDIGDSGGFFTPSIATFGVFLRGEYIY